MVKITKSIFFAPKDAKLARKISIQTPGKFRKSIALLEKNGITVKENQALVLAKTRAKVQLLRKNLSIRERKQMKAISKIKIPMARRATAIAIRRKTRRAR